MRNKTSCYPWFRYITPAIAFVFLVSTGEAGVSYYDLQPEIIDSVVAIKDVCAWPKITLLPDGTIAAAGFNYPGHQTSPGDIDLWVSEDGGHNWAYRSTPAPREGWGDLRVNHAIGQANNGDLLVIAGGKDEVYGNLMKPWVSRSSDGGFTWTVDKTGFSTSNDGRELVPFGNILPANNGDLVMPGYTPYYGDCLSYIFRSSDDGVTWTHDATYPNDEDYGENSILHLGGGQWLSAIRTHTTDGASVNHYLTLFRSDDDAHTWYKVEQLTGNGKMPAHLLELDDGQILVTYGNRIGGSYGVDAKISVDRGVTWSDSFKIDETLSDDCGYPSSVQTPDGNIVTAYYSKTSEAYDGYHMGAVIWQPGNPVPIGCVSRGDPADRPIYVDNGQLGKVESNTVVIGCLDSREVAQVFAFELPDLYEGQVIESINLDLTVSPDVSGTPNFNADLFAIAWRPGPAEVIASDATGGFLIQADFLTLPPPEGGTVLSTSEVGNEALLAIIEAAYTAGAVGGDFLYLRLDPEDGWTPPAETTFMRIYSGDNGDPNLRPSLTFQLSHIIGDANGDGNVDDVDAAILAANWQTRGGASWWQGDFNSDGNVDDADATLLAANWRHKPLATVPEPSCMAMLVCMVISAVLLNRISTTSPWNGSFGH